jgi:hypothetical protein
LVSKIGRYFIAGFRMTPDTIVEYFDVFKGRLPQVVFREQLLAGKFYF